MIKSRWYTSPLFLFIFILIALGSSLAIYITSYIEVNTTLSTFIMQHNFGQTTFIRTWPNIVILSTLVATIITAVAFIYAYYQKLIQLYRMQHNFINGFTHELKSPVTSLKLYLDTFSRYELPRDEQMKYLEYMKRDTKRLSDNISQILNLARFEEKKYKIDYDNILFPAFIQDIIKNNSHIYEKILIHFRRTHYVNIWGDRHLLEVLFTNILTNAITYNEAPVAQIIIDVENQDKMIEIRISDNGIGIDKNKQNKIFKKFYRAKKAVKGSGIGLYTAYHIVKLHQGKISVSSKGLGHGSTFTIALPKGDYGK